MDGPTLFDAQNGNGDENGPEIVWYENLVYPMCIFQRRMSMRRYKLIIVIGIASILVAIAAGVTTRIIMPAKAGWSQLPVKQGCLFAQNIGLWATGRCYLTKDAKAALGEAARLLDKDGNGAVIAYLDGSSRHGGKLFPHLSHRRGIDVDITYIGTRPDGSVFPAGGSLFTLGYLVKYNKNGKSGELTFDAKRNLAIVRALLLQTVNKVEKIFVEPHLEKRLLNAARKAKLSSIEIKRIANVLRYAGRNAAKHDDHMHVRFAHK